jgi:hypothetical protein
LHKLNHAEHLKELRVNIVGQQTPPPVAEKYQIISVFKLIARAVTHERGCGADALEQLIEIRAIADQGAKGRQFYESDCFEAQDSISRYPLRLGDRLDEAPGRYLGQEKIRFLLFYGWKMRAPQVAFYRHANPASSGQEGLEDRIPNDGYVVRPVHVHC